jgi:uncharacterized damage-inducible protein DinB
MSRPILADAFGHHVWATLVLTDTCLGLTTDQLETPVPGTYGSILVTMRHLVGSDAWYLFTFTGDRTDLIDEDGMGLAELRAAMEAQGAGWARLLAQHLDPENVINEVDEDDGYQKQATVGIRFAQALHHGTDHRSQVCTALTALGIEPPSIDVWDFGLAVGGVTEILPPA